MKAKKEWIIRVILLILSLLLVAFGLRMLTAGEQIGMPNLLLTAAFLLLWISIAVMTFFLRRSMRKTLYSYTNIGLIGGILFGATLAVSLLVNNLSAFADGELTQNELYTQLIAFPRRFSFYALFVILVVCVLLAISNIALIRHEGFRLHNLFGVILGALYCGGTAVVFLINDAIRGVRFFAEESPLYFFFHLSVPLFLMLMLCYFECILAGSAILGYRAATHIPSHDKDFIIILGCSIDKRGGLLPLLKGRVNRAIRFAWEQEMDTGKPCLYVPSGGKGENEVMSEGSAMELYLLSKGAEPYEVFPEKASRNTAENLAFSKKIIDERTPDAKIAFATTNYHILRSGILARRAGFDAEGIAGDTKWYFWPNGFVREFFGILALNLKAHIFTAIVMAVIALAVGAIGYFGLL